jgi:hypothetical protein
VWYQWLPIGSQECLAPLLKFMLGATMEDAANPVVSAIQTTWHRKDPGESDAFKTWYYKLLAQRVPVCASSPETAGGVPPVAPVIPPWPRWTVWTSWLTCLMLDSGTTRTGRQRPARPRSITSMRLSSWPESVEYLGPKLLVQHIPGGPPGLLDQDQRNAWAKLSSASLRGRVHGRLSQEQPLGVLFPPHH